ncbi:TetR/AcrR family transcriptional regulator [Streptomyces sp. NBC_01433]|uniref:TetR/AcrR family transcriptional regulator n=1 Tax=Streptomyces sp. NBC_01433 TaxID=2903864 RepID=UPI00224D76FD|nr:helix-turn-helix domain-containing protein [Streptomyces sp. NBC_01433]MCX4681200.1 TetR/AcrR family transcriptional regulator [Streptomyces sp. NBC_01433]
MADTDETPPARPLRADARRNRDRLLTVATELLADSHGQLSLEAVARRADVGIATLYRHFPTREALVLAVYHHEMEQLGRRAGELLAAHGPDEALARWLGELSLYGTTRPGVADAFRAAAASRDELVHRTYTHITTALTHLLRAAAQTGSTRTDIGADDLLPAVCGAWELPDTPTARQQAGRLVGLLIDGLHVTPQPPQAELP